MRNGKVQNVLMVLVQRLQARDSRVLLLPVIMVTLQCLLALHLSESFQRLHVNDLK